MTKKATEVLRLVDKMNAARTTTAEKRRWEDLIEREHFDSGDLAALRSKLPSVTLPMAIDLAYLAHRHGDVVALRQASETLRTAKHASELELAGFVAHRFRHDLPLSVVAAAYCAFLGLPSSAFERPGEQEFFGLSWRLAARDCAKANLREVARLADRERQVVTALLRDYGIVVNDREREPPIIVGEGTNEHEAELVFDFDRLRPAIARCSSVAELRTLLGAPKTDVLWTDLDAAAHAFIGVNTFHRSMSFHVQSTQGESLVLSLRLDESERVIAFAVARRP